MSERQLEELEQVLGHRFRDPALADRALSHRSVVADRAAAVNNEQLEYLGDAVLGMLVSEYLIRAFPHWTEGQLSKSRARLVNAGSLCAAARRLGLGEHMRFGRGEEKTGGRHKPALLGDAFEAIVAAIYLDGGLEAARGFVNRALLEVAVEAEGQRLELSDHKSALQELLQARGLPVARYNVVRETGPDHRKTFWVEVHVAGLVAAGGSGANKKEAEQSAAERALEQLERSGAA
jgi:ribonuclease-3